MDHDEKLQSVKYFQDYQKRLQKARSVVIVGGGAVGVQMATDLKEIYPEKIITLVHSRDRLMPLYHSKMDEIIRRRFNALGIE
jgi:apoptosis-inducing factor 2